MIFGQNHKTLHCMKKKKTYILALLALFSLASCGPIANEKEIELSNIYGKWQEGTLYERYYADSIEYVLQSGDTIMVVGTTWDVADSVTEQEALPFNWTLSDDNKLLQSHIMFNGAITPKTYTVTELSAHAFVYHDDYGVEHSFTKVVEPVIEEQEEP